MEKFGEEAKRRSCGISIKELLKTTRSGVKEKINPAKCTDLKPLLGHTLTINCPKARSEQQDNTPHIVNT